MPNKENAIYSFKVWVASNPEFCGTINHRTANKAKYELCLELQDAWGYCEYIDLRAKKLGSPKSSREFINTAEYRGLPDLRCGQRVNVGEGVGVIKGHNPSANFDVLFDDDSPAYPGEILNCHPDGIELISRSNIENK